MLRFKVGSLSWVGCCCKSWQTCEIILFWRVEYDSLVLNRRDEEALRDGFGHIACYDVLLRPFEWFHPLLVNRTSSSWSWSLLRIFGLHAIIPIVDEETKVFQRTTTAHDVLWRNKLWMRITRWAHEDQNITTGHLPFVHSELNVKHVRHLSLRTHWQWPT